MLKDCGHKTHNALAPSAHRLNQFKLRLAAACNRNGHLAVCNRQRFEQFLERLGAPHRHRLGAVGVSISRFRIGRHRLPRAEITHCVINEPLAGNQMRQHVAR